MSFQKEMLIEETGETANYHTITKVVVDFSRLPLMDENGPILDENENMIDPGSCTEIVLSSYKSYEWYCSHQGKRENAIKHKSYSVPLLFVAEVLQSADGLKSAYEKAEDKLVEIDPFLADAIRVV